ncbi:MAG: ABC transporter ATP-binding protein [Chloroflexi bacterium]|nr:ABC transporter ATP-binding protein [Chloroflexota bacterium]
MVMGGGGAGFGAMMRGQPAGGWRLRDADRPTGPAWPIVKRLLGLIAEFRGRLLIAVGTVVTAALLQMVPPWATQEIVNHAIPAGDRRMLVLVAIGLVALHAVRYGLNYANRMAINLTSTTLVYRLAQRLFEHVQRLSLGFYERTGTGEIISRATSDVGVLQQSLTGGVVGAILGVLSMVAYGIVMAVMDWRLALLVFATVPLLLGASVIFSRLLRERYRRVQEEIAGVNAVLAENITGVRVAKAFARESEQMARFTNQNRQNLNANMSTATVQSVSTPLIQMIGTIGMAAVLLYGSGRVIEGSLSVGTLVAFVAYLTQFYAPVEELLRINTIFQQALASAERIFAFIDERPQVEEAPGATALTAVRGEVRYEGVTFGYQPDVPVLHNITLAALPGQVVALVGETGSGKTSLVNLLPRFYDPWQGRVTIDGYDARDLTLESLRAQIAVVLQETYLFAGTVRDNIAYGRLDATEAEIKAAAREAHADEFIERLPGHYGAPVGEGGVMLSRGQRQRIALARAILRDPRILILDEATSDVDTETEVVIQAALERVKRGRTVFVITHRLSTIRQADLIAVLDHGRIVERGRHEALLARPDGHYRRLIEAQFGDVETSAATPPLRQASDD